MRVVAEDGNIRVYNDAHAVLLNLPEREAVDASYAVLLETQTEEMVMDRVQQEIDDRIEREHGTRTGG